MVKACSRATWAFSTKVGSLTSRSGEKFMLVQAQLGPCDVTGVVERPARDGEFCASILG